VVDYLRSEGTMDQNNEKKELDDMQERMQEGKQDVEAAPVMPVVETIDPVIEKRVRRKLDIHVVSLLSALYLLAFLDRSNIG
jgi:hypothetical protein